MKFSKRVLNAYKEGWVKYTNFESMSFVFVVGNHCFECGNGCCPTALGIAVFNTLISRFCF